MYRLVKLVFSQMGEMLENINVLVNKEPVTVFDTFIGTVEYNDGTYLDIYQNPNGAFIGKEWKE